MSAAGRRASKARPAVLNDPAWLAKQLRTKGTMTIALELGVSRKMVRLACERHGLEAHPAGPRRGVTTAPSVRQRGELDATLALVRDRYHEAKRRRTPPTTQTLAAALRAAHEAERAGDMNAYDAALIDGAAAFALIHDHRQKLRRAA